MGRTMVQGRNYGPQVTVRRLARQRNVAAKPIFTQIARQVVKMRPADLRLPSRAWKVSSETYLTYYCLIFNTSYV